MASAKTKTLNIEDIEHLAELFKQSDWDEMHLEVEGLEVFLSNDPHARAPAHSTVAVTDGGAEASTASAASDAAEPVAAEVIPDGLVAVRAPNLGTFYRAPKPGAPPYVEIGQFVDEDTEVCLIEVMKLFTPVRAVVNGIVREVCIEDGQMVEFGQLILLIEPAA